MEKAQQDSSGPTSSPSAYHHHENHHHQSSNDRSSNLQNDLVNCLVDYLLLFFQCQLTHCLDNTTDFTSKSQVFLLASLSVQEMEGIQFIAFSNQMLVVWWSVPAQRRGYTFLRNQNVTEWKCFFCHYDEKVYLEKQERILGWYELAVQWFNHQLELSNVLLGL